MAAAVRPIEDLTSLVADARFVLLGEATHGTYEFYAVRAELTRRLIADHGFRGVALEADWPAAARADRYVRGIGGDAGPEEALADFVRFPRWLWRNQVITGLVDWLRGRGAGLYGLDVYSLRASMSAVVAYLDTIDRPAADRARRRYGCFEDLDEATYGGAAAAWDSCAEAVGAQLDELRGRAPGGEPPGARFGAEQNARLAADAEAYYRAVPGGGAGPWNLRETHMADTLDALHAHLGGAGIVVWAHNAHVGDARGTEMGVHKGEVSLGQLMRERHGPVARLVGFTTHAGSVTAARDWGGPAERRLLRPSREGSLERRLHLAGVRSGLLDLRGDAEATEPVIERLVGVVYRPEAELWCHYMNVRPAVQFDLLVHLDETRALEPLDGWAAVEAEAEGAAEGAAVAGS